MGDQRTIGDTAKLVLADVTPGERHYLSVNADLIFGTNRAARRARRAALGWRRGNGPTGFGDAVSKGCNSLRRPASPGWQVSAVSVTPDVPACLGTHIGLTDLLMSDRIPNRYANPHVFSSTFDRSPVRRRDRHCA